MREITYFYRKITSADFEESKIEKNPLPVRLNTPFQDKSYFYDYQKKCWLPFTQNHGTLQDCQTCLSETTFSTDQYFCAEFPENPREVPDFHFEHVPVAFFKRRLDIADNTDYEEGDGLFLEDLTAPELEFVFQYQYRRKKSAFDYKNLSDSNNIRKDFYGAKIETDHQNFTLKLTFLKFYREDDDFFHYFDSQDDTSIDKPLTDCPYDDCPFFLEKSFIFDLKKGFFTAEIQPFVMKFENGVLKKEYIKGDLKRKRFNCWGSFHYSDFKKYKQPLFFLRKKEAKLEDEDSLEFKKDPVPDKMFFANIFNSISGNLNEQETAFLPKEIIQKAHAAFLQLADAYTGIKVFSFTRKMDLNLARPEKNKNYSRSYNQRASIRGSYLREMYRITKIPYEPNLCHVLFSEDYGTFGKKITYKRKNSKILNRFLRKNKIHGYRLLRKLYSEYPEVLLVYMRLKNCGFKDINLYNKVFSNLTYVNILLNYDYEPLIFFARYCISKRSEIPTLNLLLKQSEREIRNFYNVADGMYMFMEYFKHIPETLRRDIIYQGFTEFNHDALTNISYRVRHPNIVFTYSEKQRKLEDKVGDYTFRLPVDSNQLCDIGTCLHNCVASYDKSVKDKKCTIVYAMKDEKYKICIEVVGNTVNQEREDHNKNPDPEMRKILREWHFRHNLVLKD